MTDVQMGRMMKEMGLAKTPLRGWAQKAFLPSYSAERIVKKITEGRRGMPAAGVAMEVASRSPLGIPAALPHYLLRTNRAMKELGISGGRRAASLLLPTSLGIGEIRRAVAKKGIGEALAKAMAKGKEGAKKGGLAGGLLGLLAGGALSAGAVKALSGKKKEEMED